MPAWLIIIQTVVPLIKTIVDMIKSNPPASDASQAHKDAHAAVVLKVAELQSAVDSVKEL